MDIERFARRAALDERGIAARNKDARLTVAEVSFAQRTANDENRIGNFMKINGRKIGVLTGALCFSSSLLGACKNDATPVDIASHTETAWTPSANDKKCSDAQNAFGFRVLKKLDKSNENVVFSPFSIATALTLVERGAAGKTRVEIEKLLLPQGFSAAQTLASSSALARGWQTADAKVQVESANSLWLRKGFALQPAFVKTAQTSFGAPVRVLDFTSSSAAPTINSWISQKTGGKIKDMVDASALRAQMLVVANAVYFHGKWQTPFEKTYTQDADFTLSSGAKKRVPMMAMPEVKTYSYAKTQNAELLALPYGNGHLDMVFVLPQKGVALSKLVSQLDSIQWTQWTNAMSEQRGHVQIPRFTLEMAQPLDLVPILKSLGMNAAFGGGGDFSGISPNIFISAVNHKAWLQVDESGTEAAASTTVEMTAGIHMPPKNSFSFIADRPFLAAIRDNRSGNLLFLAEINAPS